MKELVDKIKAIALTKTYFIKSESNQTGERIGRMEQDHRRTIDYLIR